jgi:ribosomal protein S18 acetylase RimI-like enzyme
MIRVRRANEADLEAIARIAAAGWRHAYQGLIAPEAIEDMLRQWYSVDMLRRRLSGPPLDVAESDGTVAGYVQHGPTGDAVHEVYAIYVDPILIGKGLGWALWQQVRAVAQGAAAAAIELWVVDGNRLGIDWYGRQGGHRVGRREVDFADGPHTELRYRFELRATDKAP